MSNLDEINQLGDFFLVKQCHHVSLPCYYLFAFLCCSLLVYRSAIISLPSSVALSPSIVLLLWFVHVLGFIMFELHWFFFHTRPHQRHTHTHTPDTHTKDTYTHQIHTLKTHIHTHTRATYSIRTAETHTHHQMYTEERRIYHDCGPWLDQAHRHFSQPDGKKNGYLSPAGVR